MRRIILLLVLLLPACAEVETQNPLEPQFSNDVAVPRALASGSVEFFGVQGQTGVAWEKYEFNAVRSGPGLEARGHVAWNIRLFNGELSYGRATVGCTAVEGNTVWLAGPVSYIVINGEPVIPVPAGPRWFIVRMKDMGEGTGNVDVASILSFQTFNTVPLWCNLRLGPPSSPGGALPEYPITRGNVTVH